MSQEYWNKKHSGGPQSNLALKPTPFAEYALTFFPKEGSLLELGAGLGGDAHFFQKEGYGVTATDFSDEALKVILDNFTDLTTLNVDVSQPLPFPDNNFEIVYAQMSLHYFNEETTRKIFEEIQRILKPNGIFAAMFNTIDDPLIKSEGFIEIEPDFYEGNKGKLVRYFSVELLKPLVENLFQTIALDNKGELYYKEDLPLIRFIGKK